MKNVAKETWKRFPKNLHENGFTEENIKEWIFEWLLGSFQTVEQITETINIDENKILRQKAVEVQLEKATTNKEIKTIMMAIKGSKLEEDYRSSLLKKAFEVLLFLALFQLTQLIQLIQGHVSFTCMLISHGLRLFSHSLRLISFPFILLYGASIFPPKRGSLERILFQSDSVYSR